VIPHTICLFWKQITLLFKEGRVKACSSRVEFFVSEWRIMTELHYGCVMTRKNSKLLESQSPPSITLFWSRIR
jgi:hypothetical protein